ncbi:MAG: DNA-binding transcriptional regulator [Sedimentisphaerales bacterium]|nr:DNA-binding transcriptional regulator [Sedimentisphaerales bacterium]
MSKIPKVIFLVEISRAYGRGLLRGIAKYSKLHGPWLFFMGPEFYVKGIEHSYRWMKDLDADGIIAPLWDDAIIKMIDNLGLPAVICGIEKPSLNACRVVTDDIAVGRTAAEYFLERGFRRFAYCGFDDAIWSQRRGRSFSINVTNAGFETYTYQRNTAEHRQSPEGEQKIISGWLQSLPKPVAIMACNDDRSQDVLAACRLAEIEVPAEVAILGVDDDELICDLSYPQLSSIAVNTERAGYEAARVLDKLMSGQQIKESEKIVSISPLHVVNRQSTDIMAIEDQYVAESVQFIRKHSRKVIQVGDVAEAVGLSRRALEQHFRKVLTHSVHDEIKFTRVNQMADLLISTNLTMSQIARFLGYPDASNISRYFKQKKGISPMEYRKKFGPK